MNNSEIIKFQSIKFFTHPIYNRYAASKYGQILSKKRKKILRIEGKNSCGYKYFTLYSINIKKFYAVARFVYECFKGDIPNDMEVDHIDNNKENNSIKNLQLLSHKENMRKSHCKKVKSFNIETREEKNFESIKEASEEIGVSTSLICLICKKKSKIATSKKDGMIYIFNYMD